MHNAGAVPFGVYAIVQVRPYSHDILHDRDGYADGSKNFNIPLQIQPQVFCALSFVTWAQILVYNQ